MSRQSHIHRITKETDVELTFSLDGGVVDISTGIGFFNHMLHAFAHHGGFGLQLHAAGDLDVDQHHTMEDIGLALGQALQEALGDKRGVTRFGASFVPMDESLARVVIDLSGRPFLAWRAEFPQPEAGTTNARLFREFFQALVNTSGNTIHVDLLACEETHHGLEAIFKAFGRALAQAATLQPEHLDEIPSTKGIL
ncbi:MAG: imidazoleglycerol-phosphate dehydratase HisB [Victivallales bacterium]|nr:imidazoleglycerol-phosphate dehydratase HisB [Victivallales bacterium]